MRIVSIGEASVCRHYRSLAPLQGLHGLGHQVTYCESPPSGNPRLTNDLASVAGADVILGYRMLYGNRKLVQHCIANGSAFVWDTDDDLAAVPHDTAGFRLVGRMGLQRIAAQCTQLARTADIVTTTTPALAQKYRALGVERVVEIPNFLPVDAMQQTRRKRGDLVIGWIAGHEHSAELSRVPIVQALQRLLDAHPGVRVESAGVRLNLPRDRYRFHEWVPVDQLQRFLTTWDIGIAPLADLPFNRARSDVKLKEYAASGLCWLASPVGPYVEKGEDHGGRLVPDDGWFDALDALVRDRGAREQLARRGWAWARTQSIEHAARAWESVCIEAVERRRARAA